MRIRNPIFLGICALAISFGAQAGDAVPSGNVPADLWSPPMQREASPIEVSILRREALIEAAGTLGAQSGFAMQSSVILAELDRQASALDKLYRFSSLVTADSVLPAVITEAKSAVTMGSQVMRVADVIYRIDAPARFVSVPPTWRDYLWLGLKTTTPGNTALVSPRNDAELAVWRTSVAKGWSMGKANADEVFTINLARLERDYLGMTRFSLLLARGMVESPVVAISTSVAQGSPNELRVNDTQYRVTKPTEMRLDSTKWTPVVSSKP